ncbi:cyclic nucleotide-gated ion channel 1-like [Dorcoceras hygrometricum]|uniref:Cyclic nucleotide-gated ion channel 1-like n=1 Tax=Dorcoceras hygrometricum TaxID=472368 RepID=A0A2Z7BGZ0_9LAMI|nr:cyclic nucleotide-gated ion channel 1-like [Dorcoceras hygrometricum]
MRVLGITQKLSCCICIHSYSPVEICFASYALYSICAYQDAGLKDERVTPVYLKAGGARVTPVPHLPAGTVSRYGRRSSSNAGVDFSRWCISERPAVARDQLLREISCWNFSCDDQQRALRDSEATTFCEQEPTVGFVSVFLSGY